VERVDATELAERLISKEVLGGRVEADKSVQSSEHWMNKTRGCMSLTEIESRHEKEARNRSRNEDLTASGTCRRGMRDGRNEQHGR